MAVRVLIVDDSGFFRRRVTEMLSFDSRLQVVGTASNGQEAIDQVNALKPDVITMDIEMPVMDGITATRKIMEMRPTPIIMFSSLTTDGARATLDALDAGAIDFLPKRFEDISSDHVEAKKLLCERVAKLADKSVKPQHLTTAVAVKPITKTAPPPIQKPNVAAPIAAVASAATQSGLRMVAIGTSTGGPVALQEVLTKIPGNFPFPLLLVQHMPASFTPAFASRLNGLCAIQVKEAQDGDLVQPGNAYLAPGGKQMIVERRGNDVVIRVSESDPTLTYKPSVDVTFASVAKVYQDHSLAIVMTGMGADGREGTRALKQKGSKIWTQDQGSCVVYGMPAAVKDAGLSDRELCLRDIGPALAQLR
jgi:two-component system chemotaxis response regulator CheB